MSRLKSIGILLGSNQIGGTEIQMSRLANGLFNKYKLPVTIFFYSRPSLDYFKTLSSFENSKVHYLYGSRIIHSYPKNRMVRLINNLNIELLYVVGGGKALALGIECQKLFKQIVIGVRNERFIHEKDQLKHLEYYLKEKMTIICNSDSIKKSLMNFNFSTEDKISVIKNGIKKPKIINHQKLLRPFKVLFCGNLREVKNPIYFLAVAKELIKQKLDIEFFIIGDGPLKKQMQKYIMKNNLSRKIRLLGHVPPIKVHFSEFDLTINCSKSEGSSNSILESLASGTPVVASSTTGNIEILKNKSFGYLYINSSVDDSVKGVKIFYDLDRNKYQKFSNSAIAFVNDQYSVESMVSTHYSLFSNLV